MLRRKYEYEHAALGPEMESSHMWQNIRPASQSKMTRVVK